MRYMFALVFFAACDGQALQRELDADTPEQADMAHAEGLPAGASCAKSDQCMAGYICDCAVGYDCDRKETVCVLVVGLDQ
jgi:hypothetical protein